MTWPSLSRTSFCRWPRTNGVTSPVSASRLLQLAAISYSVAVETRYCGLPSASSGPSCGSTTGTPRLTTHSDSSSNRLRDSRVGSDRTAVVMGGYLLSGLGLDAVGRGQKLLQCGRAHEPAAADHERLQ